MGAVRFSIDPDLVRELDDALEFDVFVETGTFEGAGVDAALPIFDEIHTIEISEKLYERAKQRFSGKEAVNLYLGSSNEVLGELASKLKGRPALYWLDAHETDSSGVDPEATGAPLLGELEAIGSLEEHSVVLIDDARLFLAPPPRSTAGERWPSLHEVLARLGELSDEHEVMVLDDVIVFFPSAVRARLEDYARRHGIDWLREREGMQRVATEVQALRRELDDFRKAGAASSEHSLKELGEARAQLAETGEAMTGTREQIGETRSELGQTRAELRGLNLQSQGARAAIDRLNNEMSTQERALERTLEQLQVNVEARLKGLAGQGEQLGTQIRDAQEAVGSLGADLGSRLSGLEDQVEEMRGWVGLLIEWERERQDRPSRLLAPFQVVGRPFAAAGRGLRRAGRPVAARWADARARWRVRTARALRWQPKLGRLRHHPPTPLVVPDRYEQAELPEDPPTISIVTPSYNQAPFLEQTIGSVLDQGYPKLEYIVQDGGSTDGTQEVLDRHRDRLHHCESREDDGQAHAINLGLQHAGGEVMAYLNSDDLLLPGALAYVASYFDRHPDVDVVYGHRVLIDDEGMEIGRWVLPRHTDEILAWADFIPQETLFWRRSVWEACGGAVDEDLRFAIDWDLVLRFRDAGARIVRVPRFLGAFRVHDEQKSIADADSHGAEEMSLIRRREHGTEVSRQEIGRGIRGYLRRHILLHKLYRAGILRY